MLDGFYLASAGVEQISILHIDADWYNSVKFALETFYDSVVEGGYVVLDDYGYWEGCDHALSDFLDERGIVDIQLTRPDRMGAFFRKPGVPGYRHRIFRIGRAVIIYNDRSSVNKQRRFYWNPVGDVSQFKAACDH